MNGSGLTVRGAFSCPRLQANQLDGNTKRVKIKNGPRVPRHTQLGSKGREVEWEMLEVRRLNWEARSEKWEVRSGKWEVREVRDV